MTRTTRTIEDTDGLIVRGETRPTTHTNATVSEMLDEGLAAVDETELLRLLADEVNEITAAVEELSDEELGTVVEMHARMRDDFSIISKIGGFDLRDAWWEAMNEAMEEWRDRHGHGGHPIPSYEAAEGVPKASGAVATRILDGWVAELVLIEPDAGRHAEPTTVTARATERTTITAEPAGFRGKMYDEPAWEMEGIDDDHEGTRIVIAPLETGEDLSFWTWDEFSEEWTNLRGVGHIRTWPDKTAWRNDDREPAVA